MVRSSRERVWDEGGEEFKGSVWEEGGEEFKRGSAWEEGGEEFKGGRECVGRV